MIVTRGVIREGTPAVPALSRKGLCRLMAILRRGPQTLFILVVALGLPPRVLAQEEPPPEEPLIVSRAVVPVIGQREGFAGILWRSDVALHNDSPEAVTVVVSPLPIPELFQMRTLAPGESVVMENVAADSFGIARGVTPLLIQTLARRSVTIYATAYGILEGRPTPRQIIPVLYDELPPSVQQLSSLAMNESLRTNIGLVNLGDEPALFTLALQRLAGRPLATQALIVPPTSSVHVPLNALFPLVTEGDDLTLLVDTLGPRTYAYASVVRNDTHEAYFIQPRIMMVK